MDLSGYRFAQSHDWVKADGGTGVVGITDYAQAQLGDVIYVELPKVGAEVAAGAKFGVIESVKAASDLYCPVSGTVIEVNPTLAQKPEVINTDPYGEGWLVKVELKGEPSPELLDEKAYQEFTAGL